MFRELKKHLLTIYDESEAHSLALIVMQDIANISLTNDIINNYPLTPPVQQALHRLLNHEPIQYITGYSHFCGLKIKCDHRALIPRPETEWMVTKLIAETKNNITNILDLGTGTGCIALALANAFPNAHVTAIDISDDALNLARENASLNHIGNVDFIKGDITNLTIEGQYDIIISNPPYITLSEKQDMRSNVLDFEPHTALFVPDGDELLFHRSIINFSENHLAENGTLIIEINEHLANATLALLPTASIIHDQFNKPRFIGKWGRFSYSAPQGRVFKIANKNETCF